MNLPAHEALAPAWFAVQAALLALASAAHCAGMCGAFAVHAAAGGSRGMTAYLAGKTLTYVALGSAAGALGAGAVRALDGVQPWLAVAVGLAFAYAGVRLLRGRPVPAAGGTGLGSFVAPLVSGWMRPDLPGGRFTMGALSGALPCGVVALALLQGLALGSPVAAAGFMAVFGLGTWPALIATGWLVRRATPRRRVVLAGGVLLLLLAGLTLARGAAALVHAPCPGCPPDDVTAAHAHTSM